MITAESGSFYYSLYVCVCLKFPLIKIKKTKSVNHKGNLNMDWVFDDVKGYCLFLKCDSDIMAQCLWKRKAYHLWMHSVLSTGEMTWYFEFE